MALLLFWFVFVFLLGVTVGSFLNVCVARLPYEKSIIWPGSHCPLCWQPIARRDNIPVLGYFLLGGRCRTCHGRISWRYPAVELATGLAFVALFYLEMVRNVLNLPALAGRFPGALGLIPPEALCVYFHHVILISFLIVTSLCDLDDMEIPLSVTATGTVVGLALAVLFPWPFPDQVRVVHPVFGRPMPNSGGTYAWPVWYPLPDWLPAGSWQLGLATGLAGALAGTALLRGVRFLFSVGRGKEGLGVGDADLMMMAGAFVGWQPVVLAFFVSVAPALGFAVVQLLRRGGGALPFGPSLALGVVLTVLCWPALGPPFALAFFDPIFLAVMGVGGGGAFLMVSFLLRLARGGADTAAGAGS
jgi:leader peptidase (prepilin peptidase)/N-methyltransferase